MARSRWNHGRAKAKDLSGSLPQNTSHDGLPVLTQSMGGGMATLAQPRNAEMSVAFVARIMMCRDTTASATPQATRRTTQDATPHCPTDPKMNFCRIWTDHADNLHRNGHPASLFVSPPAESASNAPFRRSLTPQWRDRYHPPCAVFGLCLVLAACSEPPTPPRQCHWTYNRFQWTQIDSAGIYWRNYVTDSTLICP